LRKNSKSFSSENHKNKRVLLVGNKAENEFLEPDYKVEFI
jgi:hypothetical protein